MSAADNAEQARAWNDDEGPHWAEHQQRYDRMMGKLSPRLLTAAGIAPRDGVLDVGCGCGQTTRLAAGAAPEGGALGVDLSAPMLARARQLAEEEGIANVTFEQADAQVERFDTEGFDVAISRYGVMFFAEPATAFANIASAVRPGGRLAFLCWQDALRNEWISVMAGAALEHVPMPELGGDGPGPFSLADRDHTAAVLRDAGWSDVALEPVEEPVWLGADPADVVSFIAGTGLARGLLEHVDEATAAKAMNAVSEALVPYQRDDGVSLGSASWLVTARR